MKREVWPVMITPFTNDGKVDYGALRALIEWYEAAGVDGLFAVCQSSEMFFLTLEERVDIAAFVKKHASVPVIASGHVSDSVEGQIDEMRRIGETGVDALVFVTNRFAKENEGAEAFRMNMEKVMAGLDAAIPLGLYECPYPYKRLMREEDVRFCAESGRFSFLKDTCCDIEVIGKRLEIMSGSGFKLYNANTTTLLESLKIGAAGFSGVMANFHPELYVKLCRVVGQACNAEDCCVSEAEALQALLTLCSMIERQCYPVNAKYHLKELGVINSTFTRSRSDKELTVTFMDEVRQMNEMIRRMGL